MFSSVWLVMTRRNLSLNLTLSLMLRWMLPSPSVGVGFPNGLVVVEGFHINLAIRLLVRHDDEGLLPLTIAHFIAHGFAFLDATFGQRVIVVGVVAVEEVAAHHGPVIAHTVVEDGVELELVVADGSIFVATLDFVQSGPKCIALERLQGLVPCFFVRLP